MGSNKIEEKDFLSLNNYYFDKVCKGKSDDDSKNSKRSNKIKF